MKVELLFFRDDANGEYGIAHSNAIDEGFNAFWTGIGIFHDVFEHSHEGKHKYFKGDYAFNVAGEMAAMGSCFYYYNELGVYNRMSGNYYFKGTDRNIIDSGMTLAHENIYSGCGNFGYELRTKIPYQKPLNTNYFDEVVNDSYAEEIERVKFNGDWQLNQYDRQEELDQSRSYKKSCTWSKVLRIHRYGYRMAQRLVPDNWENRDTLVNFINYWNDFTKKNSAEDMFNYFQGITFNITKHKGCIKWTATLIGRGFAKNVRLNEDREFDLEDYYAGQEFDYYN